jgi:hypothetical protein
LQAADLYVDLIGPHYNVRLRVDQRRAGHSVRTASAKSPHNLNTVELMGYRVYNGDIMKSWATGSKSPTTLQVLANMTTFAPDNQFVRRKEQTPRRNAYPVTFMYPFISTSSSFFTSPVSSPLAAFATLAIMMHTATSS